MLALPGTALRSQPRPASALQRLFRGQKARSRGRILAVKWGYNPNSSSLGVDVTFLLLGLSVITLLTPLIGFLLRWQRASRIPPQ